MRSLAAAVALMATLASAADPPIPASQGFVTDQAGVIDAAVETRLTALLTELRAKTGAEIAILTVRTTAPLDDFAYAMRVVEAWKPGKKGEDTGLLLLVAVDDRKLRVLTGYGLEGILPDGLVGAIQDDVIVPAFRAGRMAEGIERGVRELASRIAASRDVELTGVPPPRRRDPAPSPLPTWALVLILLVVGGLVLVTMYAASQGPPRRYRGRRRGGWYAPGGFGGGFGGGGGGFGGFGGGGFGGGGAGRSW